MMKKYIGLCFLLFVLTVLSGCNIIKDDEFMNNVKCYELGRDYFNKLEKEADKINEIFKDEHLSYIFLNVFILR